MKTETINGISEELEKVQRLIRAIERDRKTLAGCNEDAAEMEAQINKLGKLSYKNEQALRERQFLKEKLELCQAEAAELEQSVPIALNTLCSTLTPSAMFALRLLQPIYDQRVKTIAAVLRQFSQTEESARELAKKTDSCMSAGRALMAYSQVPSQGPWAFDYAKKLARLFTEAVKKDANLLPFIVPKDQPTEAAENNETAAAGEESGE
jgi:hypothetical protein